MIGAAGVLPSFAQGGNVYSVNVVGYITLTLSNTYTMIANQLDDKNKNYVTNLFSTSPAGMRFSKFTGAGYNTATKTASGWSGVTGITCAPGEGLFVQKPVNPAVVTLTMVGEVMQGDLANPIVNGYEIYGAMVPQEGGVSTVHGYPLVNAGDRLSQYTAAGYVTRTTVPVSPATTPPTYKWSVEPVIKVGEGFWVQAAGAKPWNRTFNVQ
jgi:hypothetical protein